MKKIFLVFAFIVTVIFLNGCAVPADVPTSTPPPAYPVGELVSSTLTEGAYPIPQPQYIPFETPNPYPSDAASVSPDAFRLQKPIYAGDTKVRGTGPAGVPILLMNITKMGLPLAETVIDSNGQFVFKLSSGLESGQRIGILLGNLEGTQWKVEDFYPRRYYGEEARQVPQIGFFYDTALVKDKP